MIAAAHLVERRNNSRERSRLAPAHELRFARLIRGAPPPFDEASDCGARATLPYRFQRQTQAGKSVKSAFLPDTGFFAGSLARSP
jgi:hypothetical protein